MVVELTNCMYDFDDFIEELDRIKGGIASISMLLIVGRGDFSKKPSILSESIEWTNLVDLYADNLRTIPEHAFEKAIELQYVQLENVEFFGGVVFKR